MGELSRLARSRPGVAIITLCLLLFVYLFALSEHVPRNFLSYATRPIWDTSEAPKNRIAYRNTTGLSNQEMCALYGWNVRDQEPLVFDATIFSTELDLLLIRLHELSPHVTNFFILESNTTFTGLPKPLLLPKALETDQRFQLFKSKIKFRSFDGRQLAPGENPFTLENEIRAAMTSFLIENFPNDSIPLMFFSDVDEIVSRETAKLLSTCDWTAKHGTAIHLGMREFIYSFEFEIPGEGSWRPQAVEWKQSGRGADEFYRHGKITETLLENSGWHCSWCFRTLDQFATKARGYSHVDRLGSRPDALLRPSRIQKTICQGSDIFAMLPEAYTYRDLIAKLRMIPSKNVKNPPELLQQNPKDFPYLLPGGCIREK